MIIPDRWPDNPLAKAPIDDQEAMALIALKNGVANAGQQMMALKAIVQKMAGTYDTSYRPGPDGSRLTDFAEGKRFVGQQILSALDRKFATVEDAKHASRRTKPDAPGRRNPKPERPAGG